MMLMTRKLIGGGRVDIEQILPSGKGLNENGRGENRMMAKMTTGTKTQMGWGLGGGSVPILALIISTSGDLFENSLLDLEVFQFHFLFSISTLRHFHFTFHSRNE